MIHLPLAQDLDKEIYSPHEFHNRVRKALLITAELRTSHFAGVITPRELSALTQDHMALAARRINENPPSVRPNGSPTADLITAFLHVIRTAQPSAGRGRSVHQPRWVAEFTTDLHQAIPIAFDVFWNKFNGRPTADLIDGLSVRQMTAAARRIRPDGRMPTQVGARAELLVRHLLRVIHDAQPDTPEATPAPVTAAQLGQPRQGDATSLHEAVAAAIAAASESKTPTIVVLSFPQ
ncbi:hypothetical protein ABZ023_34035 [Streptomyces sp. NPDC006367]|uniref:hypothetical protein n=1 Tax=unclassified Streptomyces TaxID=2593676 RepID=UPI00339EB9AE